MITEVPLAHHFFHSSNVLRDDLDGFLDDSLGFIVEISGVCHDKSQPGPAVVDDLVENARSA
jgi:hypothetical protein